MSAGRELMARGNFTGAIPLFKSAEENFAASGALPSRLHALQALAEAQQALGNHRHAVATLESAIVLATAANDDHRVTLLKAQLGSVHLQAGTGDVARPLLTEALAAAHAAGRPALVAAILNDLGSLYRASSEEEAARAAYDEARRLVQDLDASDLRLRILLNSAALDLDARKPHPAFSHTLAARDAVGRMAAQPYLQAYNLVRIGSIFSEIARLDLDARHTAGRAAHDALSAARLLANQLGQSRLLSAANGVLAGVYLHAGRNEDALVLTRRAVDDAQRAGAADLLFRWHWQAARAQRARAENDLAIASYRHALAVYETGNLMPRTADVILPAGDPIHTMFLEFADLLLKRSGELNTAEAPKYLIEARDAVEKLKTHELHDYFRDSCVAEARARNKGLVQSLGVGTAVLYPIVLPDRMELLLNIGTEIKRYVVAEKEVTVLEAARRLRVTVESQRTRAYLAPAQTLYRWLIAPIAADLLGANITTLVTIPDRALRAVPMAALHDGERFLGERMAVVMAPGLELTDPRPLPARAAKSLLVGLSESAQGFPALLHVETELDNISGRFAGRTLKNEAFVRAELEKALTRERYHIAHIASHGEFSGDVRESFVLAYDGKISVDALARYIGFNRFRDDPLDLLTLSACQTAAGDEHAGLGLAGITVKAGARSALASLWPIHDEATSLLMTEFYRQLGTPGVSKAQALRRAQQQLAAITRYRHPGYWSGFVLIGNWL